MTVLETLLLGGSLIIIKVYTVINEQNSNDSLVLGFEALPTGSLAYVIGFFCTFFVGNISSTIDESLFLQ